MRKRRMWQEGGKKKPEVTGIRIGKKEALGSGSKSELEEKLKT